MVLPLLKLKRRIKKLLKVQSEARQRPQSSFQSRTFKYVLLIAFSFLVGILYPGESLFDPLNMPQEGEISHEYVTAPFRITILKTDRELQTETENVRSQVALVIDYDTLVARSATGSLRQFITLVDSLRRTDDRSLFEVDSSAFNFVSRRFPLLSTSAITQSFRQDSLWKMFGVLSALYDTLIYDVGVLPDGYALPEHGGRHIMIRKGESRLLFDRSKLFSTTEATSRLLSALNRISKEESINLDNYYLIGRAFIQPNLRINKAEYDRQVQEAIASISRVKEVVEKDDIILRAGQRVSERQERILREMARLQRAEGMEGGWLMALIPGGARVLLILAAFITLMLFLYHFRKDIYRSNPKLIALLLVFALQLFIVYLTGVQAELSVYLYAVALLPILITVLFDAEVGVLSTIILAFVLGIMHRFDFTLTFMTVVVGTVACFTSRHIRRRTEFFRISYSLALTFAAYILVVETLKLTPNPDLLGDIGYGVLNGIVTPLIAMAILPFFESLFGITTDITLLELSDLNHPLLKRLALEAPGTFHHSIIVGNLSEAAAKAIGANHLLARVGAYFHDIGKIEIPEYFVENQLSVKSRHEELTPSMSSMILSSHVKMGRKLGEDADIPDDVLNFIEEHHGTMVQSYFYNKAIEHGMDEVSADKFRYPGPRPQTRETGIAMLADAVEAASRTLEEPKPARISNLIQRIINDRFQSSELDECPLTLRDLARIKEAFTQILIGIFHQRIAYPKRDKSEEE